MKSTVVKKSRKIRKHFNSRQENSIFSQTDKIIVASRVLIGWPGADWMKRNVENTLIFTALDTRDI